MTCRRAEADNQVVSQQLANTLPGGRFAEEPPTRNLPSMHDRGRVSAIVLLAISLGFIGWAVWLRLTPGGSGALEWTQLIVGLVCSSYAGRALRLDDSTLFKRCRVILVVFAVAGAVIVLGLGADQNSSRTFARLGWGALVSGIVGSVISWYRFPQYRAATIVLGIVGLFIGIGGVGLTLNCDPVIQNTWCDPLFEREQAVNEQVQVEGDVIRRGRAGGTQGAALAVYGVEPGATIEDLTDPPGEWVYEERPVQSNEDERGVYTTTQPDFADCEINVKIDSPPTGRVETVLVSCGLGG